jgi:hypothetical protein
MGYVVIAVAVLFALALLSRLMNRHADPPSFPARTLLHPELDAPPTVSNDSTDSDEQLPQAKVAAASAYGTTVKMQPIPGAPNNDISTERQVSKHGTATITRRTGRRVKTDRHLSEAIRAETVSQAESQAQSSEAVSRD